MGRNAKLTTLRPRLAAIDTRTALPPAKTALPFYRTPEWRALVDRLIRERGRRCQGPSCGRTGTRLFADHVHELQDGGAALDPGNIQLLCGSCHTAKTARVRAARQATRHVRPDPT